MITNMLNILRYWRISDPTRNIRTITGIVQQKISIHSHKNDETVWHSLKDTESIQLLQFTEKPTLVTIDFLEEGLKSPYFTISQLKGPDIPCILENTVDVLDNSCIAKRSIVVKDDSLTFRHTLNYPVELSIILEVNQVVSLEGYFDELEIFHVLLISNK